jgi:hypothetical protein
MIVDSFTCVQCGIHHERLVQKIQRVNGYCSSTCSNIGRAKSPEERFWKRVTKTDTCWLWDKGRPDGYAQFQPSKRLKTRIQVHRFSYQTLVGPIPYGMTLDHLCHTNDLTCRGGPSCLHRRCVNPDHLEPVPMPVNTLRGRSAWAENARKTVCLRGHDNWVHTKRQRTCLTCAALRAKQYRQRRMKAAS